LQKGLLELLQNLVRIGQPIMAGDGHFAAQNALLGIPDGASPASPPPWLA